MTLSNRLWRAIAHRFRDSDDPTKIMVWAKVEHEARGKRHYQRHITLDVLERSVTLWLLMHPRDDYFRFLLAHERETNPEFAL